MQTQFASPLDLPPAAATPRGSRYLVVIAIAIGVLAANSFLLGAWAVRTLSPAMGNGIYLGVRVVALVALGFALLRVGERSRVSALGASAFGEFVDQVGFQWVRFMLAPGVGPDAGLSGAGGAFDAFIGLFMSYMMFFPFVILISFLGTELAVLLPRTNSRSHRHFS